MVFSSVTFLLFFLPVVLGVYFLIRKEYRNFFLLLASLFFYFWGENIHLWVIAVYIVANYFFGLGIERLRSAEKNRQAKYVLIGSLVFNVGVLFIFKYLGFFLGILSSVLGNFHVAIPATTLHLPLGISFFAFQGISYVVDIYRKEVSAQKNFIDFGMYKAFFGQLIAGPIVRYKDVSEQIRGRVVTLDKFTTGVKRFIIGLAKKMLLANTFAVVADRVFAQNPSELIFPVAWVGVLCYGLQIYFDFSGYSDMAIGLGKMFGFDFLENFNYPYVATSIKEFWQRWHISLSRWFRDYLYIPLGGDRKGYIRTFINLFIVFLLCGLWHGANFTFILWGAWYGAFLVIERLPFVKKYISKIPKVFMFGYVILIVSIGWVFFRSDTVSHAFSYIQSMFHFAAFSVSDVHSFLSRNNLYMMIVGCLLSTPFIWKGFEKVKNFARSKTQWHIVFLSIEILLFIGLLFLCIMMLSKNTYNPFIYYRF